MTLIECGPQFLNHWEQPLRPDNMFNFPAASPHFYSPCDARCHGAAVSSPSAWNGKERGGGGAESREACNSLKHHASFLSEGLCWLPSRWFTGPWRSRFVLLPETGFLDSASRHSAGEREKKKSISTSRLICYRLYLSLRKKKKKRKNLPDVRTCRFLHLLDWLSTQQITPQRPFEQLSTWLKYVLKRKTKKRDELNYKHVNRQMMLPDHLERFEIFIPPTTSTSSN